MDHHFSGINSGDLHRIGNDEFDRFRKFVSSQIGISLSDNKNYLVESRLRNILTEHGLPNIDALLGFIESHHNSSLVDDVVNAITTHETFWFRDTYFHDYIGHVLLPQLLKNTPADRSIEVWSAACSSGQEAYSFSMLVDQCLGRLSLQHPKLPEVHVLGTDISKQMIEHAKSAVYSQLELARGLSESMYHQYFDKLPSGKAQVKESVRQRVRFHCHNLLESFNSVGTFDVVMCRNVLIYFDEKTSESILRRIHSVLRKDGILFLCSTENMHGLDDLYTLEPSPVGSMYRAIK